MKLLPKLVLAIVIGLGISFNLTNVKSVHATDYCEALYWSAYDQVFSACMADPANRYLPYTMCMDQAGAYASQVTIYAGCSYFPPQ